LPEIQETGKKGKKGGEKETMSLHPRRYPVKREGRKKKGYHLTQRDTLPGGETWPEMGKLHREKKKKKKGGKDPSIPLQSASLCRVRREKEKKKESGTSD